MAELPHIYGDYDYEAEAGYADLPIRFRMFVLFQRSAHTNELAR